MMSNSSGDSNPMMAESSGGDDGISSSSIMEEDSPSSSSMGQDLFETSARHDEGSNRGTMALPREHSYLEESHPLLPDGGRYQRTANSSSPSTTTLASNHRPIHELAVLELHGVVLFPGSTIPVKLQNRSMIRYLGKQIQLCRTDPVAQPRVLIGILPYEPSPSPAPRHEHEIGLRRRRPGSDGRGSWMRQRFSFGNGGIAPTASSYRLRESLTRLQDEFQFLDPEEDSDNDSEDSDAGFHFDDEDEQLFMSQSSQQRNRSTTLPTPSHPLVGRIGTIATVQHTHERTSTSSLWGRYEEAPELVFTAVGTGRFRIISCIRDEEDIFEVEELIEASCLYRPPFSSASLPFGEHKITDRIRSQVNDDMGTRTASVQMLTPSKRMAWNLSQLTPLPYFVYNHRMPWSLVEKIAAALETNNGKGNLPSLGDNSIVTNRSKLEPRRFSYWMANNAPFSEGERLKLLKMDSVLERLLYIWKSVERLTSQTTLSKICCGRCGVALADISQIFVVGGAEGTTSAYVNGHGFIHQITTLRKVIHENRISFRDSPSTENSYFPGYSWLITCCSRCGSMLGWKFQKVSLSSHENEDSEGDDDTNVNNSVNKRVNDKDTLMRPPYFYGFMASNVKVISSSSSSSSTH